MSTIQKIHMGDDEELTKGHFCNAMVVACIDFRFQQYLRKFEDEHINGGYDLMEFAGGVKNIDLVLEEVEISRGLHKIKELYLINHEECGAYSEESTYENHKNDLLNAKQKITNKYPELNVYTYYLHLNGDFEEISKD